MLPPGSVLNPQFPAAVGMRSLTCGRLRSLIFGAFAMAVPERMPSAPAGATSIVNMAAEDRRTGRRTITAIAPIVGGGGGMPHRDGTDGSGADSAYLKNSPIEITESEAPVRILRYGLMPDSGGPGAHRGGMAQVLEFQSTSPDAFVTARNRDRSIFQPWAILGGMPGQMRQFHAEPGFTRARSTSAISTRCGLGQATCCASCRRVAPAVAILSCEHPTRFCAIGRPVVSQQRARGATMASRWRMAAVRSTRPTICERLARIGQGFDPGPARRRP